MTSPSPWTHDRGRSESSSSPSRPRFPNSTPLTMDDTNTRTITPSKSSIEVSKMRRPSAPSMYSTLSQHSYSAPSSPINKSSKVNMNRSVSAYTHPPPKPALPTSRAHSKSTNTKPALPSPNSSPSLSLHSPPMTTKLLPSTPVASSMNSSPPGSTKLLKPVVPKKPRGLSTPSYEPNFNTYNNNNRNNISDSSAQNFRRKSDSPVCRQSCVHVPSTAMVPTKLRRPSTEYLPNSNIHDPDIPIDMGGIWSRALFDFTPEEEGDLSFRKDDVIYIVDYSDNDWWEASMDNGERVGWVPSTYLEVLDELNTAVDEAEVDSTSERSSYVDIQPKMSSEEKRMYIVKEIFETERDFGRDLQLIIHGFLMPMRGHKDLFNPVVVERIFSNIEAIGSFQRAFVKELSNAIAPGPSYDSMVGNCFTSNKEGFKVFSAYCNNHATAMEEMGTLKDSKQRTFFQGCQLLANTAITLEGYLLVPVQRICKYPLLLRELYKLTPVEHPDHHNAEKALESMKEVCSHINELKRRLESAEKIAEWQDTVLDWEGPDITQTSSELLLESPLMKISSGHCQERIFSLFDNLLVYSKKEIIVVKGKDKQFKGRIPTTQFTVEDIDDGEVSYKGNKIKEAFRIIRKDDKKKDYILFAKTSESKAQWLAAFESEQRKCIDDSKKGLSIVPSGPFVVDPKNGDYSDKQPKKSGRRRLRKNKKNSNAVVSVYSTSDNIEPDRTMFKITPQMIKQTRGSFEHTESVYD